MVRIIIKGGVWKNTEDEVLKAAIAKYGKNQWARISSLLVRKTPKQCKARWYEWLDPSIKKTEWSKTEDEKLMHLAKLMSTQWRTIAPIVGRTANQCIERYQRLLDEAEARENDELGLSGAVGDAGPSADDIRRLRPGEIDPDPETKPARPDPIDMDEDEKEMLSEARARLANTQGKKAKRKARERQLEEARRLAVLQKKRELKAAGIIMRHKTKTKGMDYNADIPFEKRPAPGFYDTSEEQARVTTAPVGQTLRRLENKRKPEEEEAERKKRQRKNGGGKEGEDANHQTKFIAARDAQIQKLKEAESISRRRKLILPTAQVGEEELEDIVKIGRAGENAKVMVAGGTDASQRLLSKHEGLEAARMMRTPRTAPQHDTVMMEARNLRNMTMAQTPLLGEENTPIHSAPNGGTGFESATPRHQVAFTPNPLATPRDGSSRTLRTPLGTPMRDSLQIVGNPYSDVNDTPRDQRMKANLSKRVLTTGFMNLPKPENNFELMMPEEDADESEELELTEEDAADCAAKIQRAQAEEVRKMELRRSLVVQRGLPRAVNLDVGRLTLRLSSALVEDDKQLRLAQEMIHSELVEVMQHDTLTYPLAGTSMPGSSRSVYQSPELEDLEKARDAIQQELAAGLGTTHVNPANLPEILGVVSEEGKEADHNSWGSLRERLAFDVSGMKWADPDSLSVDERLAGYAFILDRLRDIMTTEATKAAKSEKKLRTILGGYEARARTFSKRVVDASEEMQTTKIELDSFSRLSINEKAMGPRRLATLSEEVKRLETKEARLQELYAELEAEKRQVEHRVALLEEKVMEDAEAFNESQLDKGD